MSRNDTAISSEECPKRDRIAEGDARTTFPQKKGSWSFLGKRLGFRRYKPKAVMKSIRTVYFSCKEDAERGCVESPQSKDFPSTLGFVVAVEVLRDILK